MRSSELNILILYLLLKSQILFCNGIQSQHKHTYDSSALMLCTWVIYLFSFWLWMTSVIAALCHIYFSFMFLFSFYFTWYFLFLVSFHFINFVVVFVFVKATHEIKTKSLSQYINFRGVLESTIHRLKCLAYYYYYKSTAQ